MQRQFRTALLAMATVFGAAGMVQAQDTLTAPQVRAQLEAQGFTNVHDVKFDNGMWEADATSADGKRTELRLDPRTGTVYPDTAVSQLSEADVRAKLSTAGYSNVHDVKFDDGMWKADGKSPNGRNVEVRLDPTNGDVIAEKRD
ncbi:PepSY domain-containing protein [Stenotrophomonas sp. SY1]|uniref:PepSY domain-containing protein n=1 Tax=Stenotrophomonas sp. SY1 TaxID=477235 RepID=UPI001E44EC21|nr:PepSY domain-containing protein [Stenotrophomonas sp. SY1]MCD9086467.1 PepSY domain-containing protein [Stenotrophomonas sp. SY1]